MAIAGLDEEEIVRLLSMYVTDHGLTLEETHGAQAVTAVESMRDLIKARMNIDQQNLSLWADFEDDPEGVGVELAGWLEAFVEADSGFATRLNGFWEEFQEAVRRTGVSIDAVEADADADTGLDGTGIASDGEGAGSEASAGAGSGIGSAMDAGGGGVEEGDAYDDEVINDDISIGDAPVILRQDEKDEEYPENAVYMYGNMEGHEFYTGSNLGLEQDNRDMREKLEAIDDPDTLQLVEAEGMPGLFQQLFDAVDDHPTLSEANKDVIIEKLREMEAQVARGGKANEELLIRDIRDIRCIAPDIMDVMLPGMEGFAEEVSGPLRKALAKIEKAEAQEEREL